MQPRSLCRGGALHHSLSGPPAQHEKLLQGKMAPGYKALEVMEQHLKARLFFVGGRYSIADNALYGDTHVADEGGIDLSKFPAVRAWLDQVQAQPGYVEMDG